MPCPYFFSFLVLCTLTCMCAPSAGISKKQLKLSWLLVGAAPRNSANDWARSSARALALPREPCEHQKHDIARTHWVFSGHKGLVYYATARLCGIAKTLLRWICRIDVWTVFFSTGWPEMVFRCDRVVQSFNENEKCILRCLVSNSEAKYFP